MTEIEVLVKSLDFLPDWLKPLAFPSLIGTGITWGAFRLILYNRKAGFLKTGAQKRRERSEFIRKRLQDTFADDPEEIAFLKDELATISFEEIAGFRAKRHFRKELLEIYRKASGEIDWWVFRRALPYLREEDNSPAIHFNLFDRLALGFFGLASIFLAAMVFSLLFILGHVNSTQANQANYWPLVTALNLILGALCAWARASPLRCLPGHQAEQRN